MTAENEAGEEARKVGGGRRWMAGGENRIYGEVCRSFFGERTCSTDDGGTEDDWADRGAVVAET